MPRPLHRSLLHCTTAVVLTLAIPNVVLATPTEDGAVPKDVFVSVRATGAADERTERVNESVRLKATEALRDQHQIAEAADPDHAGGKVEILVGQLDLADLKYKIGFRVESGGNARSLALSDCDGGVGALVKCVNARLPEVVEALHQANLPDEPPPPEPVLEDSSPPVEPERKKGLGPLGKTGVGVLVVGGAAFVSGVVLTVLGPRVTSDAQDPDGAGTNYRTPGLVLLGTGTAAVVAGAVMLGVDRKRRRSTSAAFVPGLDRRSFVMSVSGRF